MKKSRVFATIVEDVRYQRRVWYRQAKIWSGNVFRKGDVLLPNDESAEFVCERKGAAEGEMYRQKITVSFICKRKEQWLFYLKKYS